MEQDGAHRLSALYNCLYKETDDLYHSLARHFGLSDGAFWVLYMLRESGRSCTQHELSEQLSMSKQTVNSALKGLEAAGVLTLAPQAENRRSKSICLTAKGERLAVDTVDRVLAMERSAFEALSETEQDLFLRLVQKHVRQLQAQAEQILTASAEDL